MAEKMPATAGTLRMSVSASALSDPGERRMFLGAYVPDRASPERGTWFGAVGGTASEAMFALGAACRGKAWSEVKQFVAVSGDGAGPVHISGTDPDDVRATGSRDDWWVFLVGELAPLIVRLMNWKPNTVTAEWVARPENN